MDNKVDILQNKLYFGDNLQILRNHVAEESVDMIYLDPPFNSNATYNVLFGEKDGSRSQAQITAFDDTWHWGEESEYVYKEIVTAGPKKLSDLIQAFQSFLGRNDMMAYLVMMAARLTELHRVLKRTGSIYLHCDPTASHYLKLILDTVFGYRNFLNEIVWKRSSAHSDSLSCGRAHDIIFLFSKEKKHVRINPIYQLYDESYVGSHYRRKSEDGRCYRTDNLTAMGLSGGGYEYEWNGVVRIWRCPQEKMKQLHDEGRLHYTRNGVAEYIRYLDEMPGTPIQDIWTDIHPINSQAKERLGYPTQKPEALLERIIRLSSNEDDLVLDPFCGCGTTINVAERLHRRWIGIDITHLAITLIKNRLHDTFGSELTKYEVIGEPQDLSSAEALAAHNRHQFEWWALGLIEARPAHDKNKGADSGVDGYINFFDDNSGKAKQIIVQVKSGHVNAGMIRDLKGVMEREKAAIGIFITLNPATKPMKKEALSAGYYEPEHLAKKHAAPRIQIITIAELLKGDTIQYPRMLVTTFKKAQRKFKDSGPKQDNFL